MDQIIREISNATLQRIKAQREWVRNHYSPESTSEYDSIEGKLKLLDVIIKSKWINKEETVKLQCLGITLGDALIQKLNLRWIEVEDNKNVDPALKLGDSSIILYPLIMISKRIENDETVDIYSLFDGIVEKVNTIIGIAD